MPAERGAGTGQVDMSKKIRIAVELLIWAALVAADQISKIAAVNGLRDKPAFPIIKNVLELYYVENRGAAFSMLQNATWFFYIVASFAIIAIAVFLVRMPENRRFVPLRILLILISAGAAGNLIDRVMFTYVRDFIYFSLINFPVFNVADIYVTCATFTLVLLTFFYYKDEDFADLGFH